MLPDVRTLRDFFAAAQRRIAWLSALRAIGSALGIAVVVSIIVAVSVPALALTISVALMLGAVAVGAGFALLRKRDPAVLIEQHVSSQNLLLTASELLD